MTDVTSEQTQAQEVEQGALQNAMLAYFQQRVVTLREEINSQQAEILDLQQRLQAYEVLPQAEEPAAAENKAG